MSLKWSDILTSRDSYGILTYCWLYEVSFLIVVWMVERSFFGLLLFFIWPCKSNTSDPCTYVVKMVKHNKICSHICTYIRFLSTLHKGVFFNYASAHSFSFVGYFLYLKIHDATVDINAVVVSLFIWPVSRAAPTSGLNFLGI